MIDKAAIDNYAKSFKPMSSDSCQIYQESHNISEWHLDYYEKISSYTDNEMNVCYVSNFMIKVSSLNYKMNYRYKLKYVENKNIKECVDENYMYPFLLFINDKFIKWDDIYITNTYKDSFICINNLPISMEIEKLKIYNVPFDIEMHTGNTVILNTNSKSESISLLFAFDSNGDIVTDYKIQTNYTTVYLVNPNSRYIVDLKYLDSSYAPTTVYKDNKLYILNDISSKYNIMQGNILFIDNGVINLDKSISILADNTVIVDSDTDISNAEKTGYVLIFDTLNDNNINNITEFNNITNGEYSLFDDYTGDSPSISATLLNKKFSLDINDTNLYSKLLDYNSKLYNELYLSDAIFNRICTYNSIIKNDNVINGLDNREKYHEMGVMIFKDGKLISYNTDNNGNIKLISDISNPDNKSIDFIRFNSIQNHVLEGTTPTDQSSTIEITNILDNTDINFSAYIDGNSGITTKYTYPIPVYLNFDNTSFSGDSNTISMQTDNDELFNKKGVYYNSNQFRHYYTKVTSDVKDRGYVLLPDKFNTCNDTNKYMVFYNGLMLSKETDVVLSLFNTNKPYYEQRVYPVHTMEVDDQIDIFYIPFNYNEYVYNGSLEITGNINIDIDNIKSPICKELLLVFINGALVPNDKISNINKNTIRITNSKSVKHLCVISFINYDNDLLEYIKTTDSDIDKIEQDATNTTIIKDGVEYNKYNYIKNIPNSDIVDTDSDVHDDSIGPEYAWMSITRDFYNVSSTNISHFSFENTIDGYDLIDDGIDPEGNVIIPAYYATLEDINYDIYEKGTRLTWTTGTNLNTIRTAIGIGNNVNDSLAIHNSLNIMNRLVEHFDGEAWSNKQYTSMDTTIITGCGVTNNCISLVNTKNINSYNGSTWSSHSTLTTGRNAASMIGQSNSAIIAGGSSANANNTTEIYNGTVWSSGQNLNNARSNHNGCGLTNAAMIIGGTFNNIESYDGSVWSNLIQLNVSRSDFGCNGQLNNSIMISGQNSGGDINTVEVYDGNTCSTLNTISTPRYLLGSSGSGLSSMIFAGISDGTGIYSSEVLKRI